MAKTPEDDTWLEQIRCPRFFDFEAALTVPCPNGSDTNPPLRDSVYESDDETRSFFRSLEKDSSLHHTPHPQENSPPPPELRKLRSIHRHRPSISFEEYLQNFKDTQASVFRNTSERPDPQKRRSGQHTPARPQQRTSSTPKRNPKGKTSQSPTETAALLSVDLPKPTLQSIPTSKFLKPNPPSPSRLPLQRSSETTRKSAPSEPLPLRRPRQPERVTPPLNSVSSKSTSGGFGRLKSRKAIARSDNTDGCQAHLPLVGQRTAFSANAKNGKEETEFVQKKDGLNENDGIGLLDVDPDILRMMEEHNRRIERRKVEIDGIAGRQNSSSGNFDEPKKKPGEQKLRWQDLDNTQRAAKTSTSQLGVLQRSTSDRVGQPSRQGRASSTGNAIAGTTAERQSSSEARQEDEKSRPRVKPKREATTVRNRRRAAVCSVHVRNPLSEIPNADNSTEETSLDELLKYENERVLEERKKRLPERRKALQADRNVALTTFEGRQTEQERERMLAKVEFTSANRNYQSGTSRLLEKNEKDDSSACTEGKENSTNDRPPAAKSRKRGLKGFRERSKIGSSLSVSTGLSTAQNTQKSSNITRTRRYQPYTDKIKALERQKRLERRLEEDLKSLLSQHNSRIQGNRRAASEQ